jgi:hypothetical protein
VSQDPTEDAGQLHTLGLLERLRSECKDLWCASSDAYFRVDGLLRELSNPNLHDINSNLGYHVELWDGRDLHIRWVVAATDTIAIQRAAFDAAVAKWPQYPFKLRKGISVIREYSPPAGNA